jgi:hypothetical protein
VLVTSCILLHWSFLKCLVWWHFGLIYIADQFSSRKYKIYDTIFDWIEYIHNENYKVRMCAPSSLVTWTKGIVLFSVLKLGWIWPIPLMPYLLLYFLCTLHYHIIPYLKPGHILNHFMVQENADADMMAYQSDWGGSIYTIEHGDRIWILLIAGYCNCFYWVFLSRYRLCYGMIPHLRAYWMSNRLNEIHISSLKTRNSRSGWTKKKAVEKCH